MRQVWLAGILLTLAACDQRAAPMAAYRHTADSLKSLPLADLLGFSPCTVRREYDGMSVMEGLPTDKCFKMLPAKRYRGIWLDQFEGSLFFEGALDVAGVDLQIRRDVGTRTSNYEWLSWNEKLAKSQGWATPLNRYVLIDFIGRRTAYPGQYGHLGMSRSEIVVDRILSVHPAGEVTAH